MKRLIYQVYVGKKSKLYDHCTASVRAYCKAHDIDYVLQDQPILMITPDVFQTNRSKEATARLGYLPIYEKENAFEYIDDFDQIAIIDADIYIRPNARNIFDQMNCKCAFGAVCEREMDIQDWYKGKITNYSQMQYGLLHSNTMDFKPNELGFEFFNMGMIVINSQIFKPYLNGQTPRQFLERMEFKDFVDGQGAWKWSTDQTLLNYFLKKYNIPTKHINSTFNGLFTAVNNIKECDFVHFFLKDKLPNKGENVEELMNAIN